MKRNLPVTEIERDYPAEERLISETDLRGIVTTANASFCEVCGFSREELVGKSHNIVRHPDMPPEAFADLWRTIQAGERWVGVVKNRCRNGDYYWVKAFVSPIVSHGQIIGYRSVRRKPSRDEIREAEALYKRIAAGEKGLLDTLGSLSRRQGIGERLGTAGHLAILTGWPGVVCTALAAGATFGLPASALWAIAGLGGLVAFLLAVLIHRWQTEPLNQISRTMAEFEAGNLSARVDLPGRSRLAQIARSVNLALDGVETAIADISQMLDGLKRGEFGRRVTITLPGELGRMKVAANSAAEQLESTVASLNAKLAALAEGRLNYSDDAGTPAEGKFREAQQNAATAAARLADLLREVVASTQALAAYDLTKSLSTTASGELGVLARQYNAALDSLAETLVTLRTYASHVAQSAAENSRAVEEIATGSEAQMTSAQQVTQSVRESGETISHLATDAERASRKSNETVAIVQSSRATMERMVSAVQAIAASSEQINTFTNVIEEIAAKTNLLSLNAAIEAARAGEHGRGFAVVAAEVGQLATNSSKSAKEISGLVQKAVEEARGAAQRVAEVTAEMDRIEQAARESNDLLARIAAAMEQQGAILGSIGEHAQHLSGIAQANAAATEELAASASELTRIAEATYAEVDRFRIAK